MYQFLTIEGHTVTPQPPPPQPNPGIPLVDVSNPSASNNVGGGRLIVTVGRQHIYTQIAGNCVYISTIVSKTAITLFLQGNE
jgi:hypothetical protein